MCTQAQVSLDAATTTGPGTIIDLGHSYSTHTLFVFQSGGSDPTVKLQLSHDGINWKTALGSAGAGGEGLTINIAARYVRAYVQMYGGAPISASIASVGD